MDNSWLRFATLSESERREHREAPDLAHGDYDEAFPFEFAEVTVTKIGQEIRARAAGCYITAITDACTRRVLALRLWPKPVGAAEMLLVLRDAMLRFGRPERLYTDNGSEFKNRIVRNALLFAGVTQVFSKPYRPQGRGKVERIFRTIKEMILPGLKGYRDGGGQSHVDDLLTLDQAERAIRERVEKWINRQPHRMTGRVPEEHFDTEIRRRLFAAYQAPVVIGVAAAELMPLLHQARAKRHEYGLECQGHWYWSAELESVMIGRWVQVAYDPFRWTEVYFQVPEPDDPTKLVVAGIAYFYNRQNAPPDLLERVRLRREFLERRAHSDELSPAARRASQPRARVRVVPPPTVPAPPNRKALPSSTGTREPASGIADTLPSLPPATAGRPVAHPAGTAAPSKRPSPPIRKYKGL